MPLMPKVERNVFGILREMQAKFILGMISTNFLSGYYKKMVPSVVSLQRLTCFGHSEQ